MPFISSDSLAHTKGLNLINIYNHNRSLSVRSAICMSNVCFHSATLQILPLCSPYFWPCLKATAKSFFSFSCWKETAINLGLGVVMSLCCPLQLDLAEQRNRGKSTNYGSSSYQRAAERCRYGSQQMWVTAAMLSVNLLGAVSLHLPCARVNNVLS